MEKKTKILIGIGIILALFLIGSIVVNTNSFYLNNYLNKIVRGEPDKTCVVDSDCKLARTDCSLCGCGEAVNVNWEGSFCPFRLNIQVLCGLCVRPEVKCINNICIKEATYGS